MNIVSKTRLKDFWEVHPLARSPLEHWHGVVSKASWSCFSDVRNTCASADLVGKNLVVFNVHGNHYRVVAGLSYSLSCVYIKHVLTHSEYDTWNKTIR
ncbi:MAG: type II toxin-antitoxin system HigB family toxin [Rubrivivax sp.]|nr:MAG: type II toxin-antitoxin system HigB family toxin [Rubrivivax sp.]